MYYLCGNKKNKNMGQYYKPLVLDKTKKKVINWVYSHDYDNGLKLMEHSWLGNSFVGAIENLLKPDGEWYMKPIVWAGDYADKENNKEYNLYSVCEDKNKINPTETKIDDEYKYIVNHTKKQYVDKSKVPVSDTYNKFEYRIHPLPLLTCEGNGRGGGDFRDDEPIVGSWARDVISIENELPIAMKEVEFNLVER
jgi:hypothetical protein